MTRLRKMLRSETGKAAVPSFLISIAAKFLQLAMAIMTARLLQPEGFGVFTFAMGVGLLGARVGGLGFPVLALRHIPQYTVEKDWDGLAGLIRASDLVVAGASLAGAVALGLLALILGADSHMYQGLLLGAVLLPVMAFRALYRHVLMGQHLPQKGILIDELIPPAVMSLALLLLWGGGMQPVTAVWLYILASALAVLVGFWWSRRHLPQEARAAYPEIRLAQWMRSALPALVGMSAKLFMNKTDVLMLTPLGTLQDVGLYGAAWRVTYLLTAPVNVLLTVTTSRISEAFAAKRNAQGKRLFYLSLGFAVAYAAPVAAGVALLAGPLMALLFGEAFRPGGPTLAILALAQLGAALNLPATSFMLMTGRENSFGRMTVAALAINVIGNLILIPPYGVVGAALATCVSIWFLTIMQLVSCLAIIRSGRFMGAR